MSNTEGEDCIQVNIKEFVDGKIKDIRDIIDTRFEELTHRMEYRAQVSQTALQEAKTELSARLAGMNEFRDTIKDLIASSATRAELEAIKDQIKHHITRAEHEALCARVTALDEKIGNCVTEEQLEALQKQIDSQKTWLNGVLVSLVFLLLAVIIDVVLRSRS